MASAAVLAACSQIALRSSAVRSGVKATGRGPVRGPPLPQLGPGQIRGEFPAAVPDGAAVLAGVAGERDRVPGDSAGVGDAESSAHQHPSFVEAGEELLLAVRGRGGGGTPAVAA